MAALRRAAQRGESLDAQAMMLLEMFTAEPGPSTYPAHATPTPRSSPAVPPPVGVVRPAGGNPTPHSSRSAVPAPPLSSEQTA
jgi:hypothetical protein